MKRKTKVAKARKAKAVPVRAKRTAGARGDAASLLELRQQVSDLRMERDEALADRARAVACLNATSRAIGMPQGQRFDTLPELVFALQRQIDALREERDEARRSAMSHMAASAALAGAEERIAIPEAAIPLGTADLHAKVEELEEHSRLEAV